LDKIIQIILIKSYKIFFSKSIFSTKYGLRFFEFLYFNYKSLIEVPEAQFLRNYIPKGGVVIDVGSNIGFFTIKFAKWVGPTGRVVSIEPDDKNFQRLTYYVKKNNYSDRVILVKSAVSEKSGQVKLFLNPYNPMDHRISNKGINVRSTTIDELCSSLELENIDFIKIDVQGAESLVIEGARKTLSNLNAVLYLEIENELYENNRVQKLVNDLYSYGYFFYTIHKNRLRLIKHSNEILHIIKINGYADFLVKK
jgi:FkbM family methyltransferase